MARRIDQLDRTTMNAFIQDAREHGIFNTKFTAVNNSTTEQSMGIDLSSSTYDINCAIRKAGSTGDVEWLSSASAIKITLSTGTVTGTIAGITVTGAYNIYAYAISNNGILIFGLSRSPYHKTVPANYTHTNTASARTRVASADTAWDQMWISISTTINATNSCVCLGYIGTVTFDGTNGRASASTLATGAVPEWSPNIGLGSGIVACWNGNGSSGTVSSPNRSVNLSLSRTSIGLYVATFSIPQPDAFYNYTVEASPDYGVAGSAYPQINNTSATTEVAPTVSGFTFQTRNAAASLYDPKYMMITVTR